MTDDVEAIPPYSGPFFKNLGHCWGHLAQFLTDLGDFESTGQELVGRRPKHQAMRTLRNFLTTSFIFAKRPSTACYR